MSGVVPSTVPVQLTGGTLQALPGLVATPLGKLLVALVVVAVVLLVGRFVMNVAWRILKVAVVVVAAVWLVSVLVPEFGL